jgi:hypothetical protein
MDAKKKIIIKINEPTIPNTPERLVKNNAPNSPPEED